MAELMVFGGESKVNVSHQPVISLAISVELVIK
jgi:hypothetical protein